MQKLYLFVMLLFALTASAETGTHYANQLSDAAFAKGWTFWSDRNSTHKTVTLPHDAMQTEQRCDTLADGRHNGFFPGDKYYYEKTLDVPASWLEKHVTLTFEGVYRNAKVFINGQEAGSNAYGYTEFTVCADGKLKSGKNVIRVEVDNSQLPNSRWYSGAGIYRPVHINVQEPVYIDNVRIDTRNIYPAIIHVCTDVRATSNSHKAYSALHTRVRARVLWKGEEVARGEGCNMCIDVPNARLWSADEPNLYQVVVELVHDGKVIDSTTKDFGIRKITWSPLGLLVNGKQTLLKGGCLHHDNGILGACEYDDAAMRRIATMKKYGFNAIRSSHNPCSEAVLKACDKLGMYVMDELWDMWYSDKTAFDYANYWEKNYKTDVEAMVKKDFCHPSVIMYSIGNEVKEPAEDRGLGVAQELVNRLHELDPSRAVTAGINLTLIYITNKNITWSEFFGGSKDEGNEKYYKSSELYNKMASVVGEIMMHSVRRPEVDTVTTPVLDMLDIAGYNYASSRYKTDAKVHPSRIIIGTETYPYKLFDNWRDVERYPFLLGDFMWTAWDYIGEVSLGAWYNSDETPEFIQKYPSLLAGAGAIDLIGNPTGEVLRAEAIWSKDDKPYLAVRPVSRKPVIKAVWRGTNSIPSWSWRGMDGVMTTAEVFTTAPKVKLYVNDSLVAEKDTKKGVASFEIPYTPGKLRAVTIDNDGEEQETTLTSATGKLQISAKPEKTEYHVGDLIYVDIDITDGKGIVESNADTQLNVQVKGGEMLGFGSANPRTAERFQTGKYTTYYGRSLAVLRADNPGNIILTVSGKGLKTIHKAITVKP